MWLLQEIGLYPRLGALRPFHDMFGHLVPLMLWHKVPYSLITVLDLGLAVLILRRLWLIAKMRSISPPASYSGWLYVLVLVAVGFLASGVVVLVGTAVLRAGSGVPGGMLLIPAALLLPSSVALVEVLSLFRKGESPNDAVHRTREHAARR